MGCGATSSVSKVSNVEFTKEPILKPPEPSPIHWKQGNLIGEGAYGKVYECLNIETGEILAVKHVELSGDKQTIIREISSLKKEITLLRGLKHKNIVRYITTQVTEDLKAVDILMEYMPGGSVRQLINKFSKLHEKTVQKYTCQLLCGLDYLHSQGIIHRDIKCANLLVDNEGTIKLSDFGASTHPRDALEINRSLKGSPYWIAPEVAARTGHSFAADVWSVGCVVIEMITGNPPWSQISRDAKEVLRIVANTRVPPEYPPRISDECKEFLDRCLRINYKERESIKMLMGHRFITEEIAYLSDDELAVVEPYEMVYNVEDIPMTQFK